jgi:hypothetical protein
MSEYECILELEVCEMPDGDRFSWSVRGRGFPDIVAAQEAICRQLGVAPDLAADRLVQLYRRHCDEWTRFPAASLAETQRKAA